MHEEHLESESTVIHMYECVLYGVETLPNDNTSVLTHELSPRH